jgi:glycerophosphoryl diester phosphodiesterase
LCQGKIGIYLDLKAALIPELVEIIRKYRLEKDIIWYIPASRMKELRQLNEICPDCIPMPDPGPEKNITTVLNQVKTLAIATDPGELSKSFVETAHRHQAMVFADEKEGNEVEWTQIIEWKTDGIQTDDPEKLILFLKGKLKK